MKRLALFFSALTFAADPPRLTPEQRAELSAATIRAMKAELEFRRLDEAYQQERAKRAEAARVAADAYSATFKKLQATAPKGCQLTEDGEFKCESANETSKAR